VTDPVPSKDLVSKLRYCGLCNSTGEDPAGGDCRRCGGSLSAERQSADEIERLQRDLYEAEKLIAVQQERITHEPRARPNLLRDETSAWEVQTQDSEGNPVVTCHTRVVGGVLCRWWGDDAPPSGVEAIDRAAQPPGAGQ
jgi:hypothetical protein